MEKTDCGGQSKLIWPSRGVTLPISSVASSKLCRTYYWYSQGKARWFLWVSTAGWARSWAQPWSWHHHPEAQPSRCWHCSRPRPDSNCYTIGCAEYFFSACPPDLFADYYSLTWDASMGQGLYRRTRCLCHSVKVSGFRKKLRRNDWQTIGYTKGARRSFGPWLAVSLMMAL